MKLPLRSRPNGFTLVGLVVIVAVLAILAALLLPALAQSKQKAKRINCVNNLKQLSIGFLIWACDNNDAFPMSVPTSKGGTKELANGAATFRHFQVMSNECGSPKILICPDDTLRTPAQDFIRMNNQNVSYFVNLDANEAEPKGFFVGDRNITGPKPPQNGILKISPGDTLAWTEALHNRNGNLALSVGSVQQLTSMGLTAALRNSGSPTNVWRIALPE